MDDYEDLAVYKVRQTPEVKEIEVFKKFQKKNSTKKQRHHRDNSGKENFKERFSQFFNLDINEFSINLVKQKGKWMIEICHRKKGKCVYQDYETICGILDRKCKLPDNLIGYNVNLKV